MFFIAMLCSRMRHVSCRHAAPSCAEKDFQEKKKELQAQAKKRLESIMLAKKKLLEFDSDFDGSMHSSELSELDSDVHSLSSLKSCANDWIEDQNYKTPAESWIKFAAPAAMVRVECSCGVLM